MNTPGAHYEPKFIDDADRTELTAWLETLSPIWEDRHPDRRALRPGQKTRRLLRPVYWLGGWQFACLNYFHPPDHVDDRVVAAEPFPPVLARLVGRIEKMAREVYTEFPEGWKLNTCLINFYGLTLRDGRWIDTARVGGHRDYEPGPMASLSLGARARFQFATRHRGPADEDVVAEQWLADSSMLLFGTPRLKSELYHRIPRVERAGDWDFPIPLDDFKVRRVNFTFRYVPDSNIVALGELGEVARLDIDRYVAELARHSPFWAEARLTPDLTVSR